MRCLRNEDNHKKSMCPYKIVVLTNWQSQVFHMQTEAPMKRTIALLLTLLVIVAVFSGCESQPSADAPAPERQKITKDLM